MAETKDARDLSTGTQIEEVYANYANKLTAMANNARLQYMKTSDIKRSPSATKTYAKEVASIKEKLTEALKNKPLERQAQVIADAEVKMTLKQNPSLYEDKDALKKVKNLALANARSITGAGKHYIKLTDKEWQAIQANAISASMLREIMANSDTDHLRDLSMPKKSKEISSATKNRIKLMDNSGYTINEIADQLGISESSVSNVLIGKK
jgi:predicted DNA binding protein